MTEMKTDAPGKIVTIYAADLRLLMTCASAAYPVPSMVAPLNDALRRCNDALAGEDGETPFAGAATPEPGSTPDAPAARGRLARVEVKGFRDLGVVRVSETTLGGEPMLHAERTPWSARDFQGDAADFPPSSLHFITWLPEGAQKPEPPALPAGLAEAVDEPDEFYDEPERQPF